MRLTSSRSGSRTLWSLASLLPDEPGRTLLHGLDRSAVRGLASVDTEPGRGPYDAAIIVSPTLPDAGRLRTFGDSLRPGGGIVLATRARRSRTHGGPPFGVGTRRSTRLLTAAGYTVDGAYGVSPSLLLPEFVVCLVPSVTADFWWNLYRPWSPSGAMAAGMAGKVPALGVRAFAWLVLVGHKGVEG